MSDEIRPIEGFGAMRQMSPYYGGADLTTPIPSEGVAPIGTITAHAQKGQQVAMNEQLPAFETAAPAEVAAQAPGGQDLAQIMKHLDDPASVNQFCQEFHEYTNKMYPENLMPPPGSDKAMKMPMGGGGLPMIPGLGNNSNALDTGNQTGTGNVGNQGSQYSPGVGSDITLSGSLDDRISQLQNALSDLESRKSQLESEIQQLQSQIQELEKQLQDLQTQKKDLETQKQQKQQEMNQARQEQQKLQQQKQQLKTSESQLTNQKQALNGQIQSLGAQITALTSQIATLKASAASMHAQAAALLSNPYTAAAGAAMEASAAAMDVQAAALEAQKVQLQAQKQQAECQLQQVNAQLQQVKAQLQQVEQQLQVADNKVKQVENELSELDRKLQEVDQQISRLQDQIMEKKRELADKKAELAQINVKIAKVKELLQQHQAMKQEQQQKQGTDGGEPNKNAIDPLSLMYMLNGLGSGSPMSMMGQDQEGGDDSRTAQEKKAKEALAAEFPGGPIDMRAQKANPDQEVSQYGTNANAQQVEEMLSQVASKYGIPQDIMKAVAWNDSRFNVKSQDPDSEAKGAIHVAPNLNPDYDVARGNQNPAYNIEFGARKLRDTYEKTQDWKIATSQFYGKDGPAAAMGAQVMAMAAQRPWETGATGSQTADAGSNAQKQGAKRG